jgi:hypothetical protein
MSGQRRTGTDGSAGDVDYGALEAEYARYRRPDPSIMAHIEQALGPARTIVNVGAGAGSYEPSDRTVTPVEPSAAMRAQRPAHLALAIDAVAEALPFPDGHFDAAMATVTVHQWQDLERGLAEMRRVATGPVVVLTCDPVVMADYWLNDYAPGVRANEARRFPPIDRIVGALGPATRVEHVPIPLDCRDGFNEAYYGRPEMFLDRAARLACSSWSFLTDEETAQFETRLAADLASGAWDRRYGHWRKEPFYDGPLRLVIG